MSQYTTEEPSKGYTKVSVHSLLEEIELKLEQASCLLEDECDNEDISVCKFELDTMVKKLREARR